MWLRVKTTLQGVDAADPMIGECSQQRAYICQGANTRQTAGHDVPSGSNWWWRTYVVLVYSYLRVIWGNNRRTDELTLLLTWDRKRALLLPKCSSSDTKKYAFFDAQLASQSPTTPILVRFFFCCTPNDGNCVDCLRNFQVYWTQNCVLLSQRKKTFRIFFILRCHT